MPGPLDQHARPLRDLRISVTDRCNFRCTYCMPKEVFGRDFAFLARGELLSEEIVQLARAFAGEGVSKVRLTGGEPLLRRGLERLVEMLADVPVNDHCVAAMDVGTTNDWRMNGVVSAAEVIETIEARWPLERLAPSYPGEVASRYRCRAHWVPDWVPASVLARLRSHPAWARERKNRP